VSGLPSGSVTFVFTDIEGSTRLVKVLRDRYALVLAEHRRVIRAAIAAHEGYEVDTQGDAFFAAFGGAKQAVLCALEVQRALAAHDWPDGGQVRVRVGVHTGQAVPVEGRYTGLAVHRAARICAAAAGGQVLVSQATQALIEDEEEGEGLGFALLDVGEHRLKDLDRPVRLFELAAAGLDMPSPGGPAAVLASRESGLGSEDRAAAGVHGLPVALTSFIGRAEPVREVTELLEQHRLVTVTGPGGSGKTRLAGEVAKRVAGRFADGAWLTELATVQDPALVASVVAAAVGIRDLPGTSAAEALVRALARRQLLLVLDNCEHVIDAAAELSAGLLAAADDVTILATSREPLAVAGEARYRLAPLALPDVDDLAGAARAEAVALFADRARSADMHFRLDEGTGPAVARLVWRLDGMPLAIELAAARVEALGVTQLLDRLDDRFALLATPKRTAPSRQRSLAATVEWSYQLLDETGQRVFRAVSVFPGPFTLEAAEAIAGEDAGPVVFRLVDCSLLVPPRAGPDSRSRYSMLETLRAYGTRLLAQAREQDAADTALGRYALGVAEQAAAGLATSTAGEVAAARWLDAEDAMTRQVLAWASERDPAAALRLGVALAPWWLLRGRASGGYPVLRAAADRAVPGEPAWCEAQFWLGQITLYSGDLTTSLGHFTAVCEAIADRGPSRALALCLGGRSVTLANLGRVAEALDQARRSLAMAEEIGDPDGQGLALMDLAIAVSGAGDLEGAVRFARQAGQIPGLRGWIARVSDYLLTFMLKDAGDTAAAETVCAAALARARDAGDQSHQAALLRMLADLNLRADRTGDAARHLREALQVIQRAGTWFEMGNVLETCGYLCAATGRPAEAITLLAAMEALYRSRHLAFPQTAPWMRRPREAMRKAREMLGADAARAAGERGTAMSTATAAEYVLLLTAPAQPAGAAGPGLGQLSGPDRELVILVARGRTDAEIAAQLSISTRTVRSRLNQIRDKTGYRRRADLTRLALHTGLV
jgi:predicted ATPase/class 3 adenylate cyclase/DNA-binding CsgD family transcriptional regulator